jgi:hypothetical protein
MSAACDYVHVTLGKSIYHLHEAPNCHSTLLLFCLKSSPSTLLSLLSLSILSKLMVMLPVLSSAVISHSLFLSHVFFMFVWC